MTVSLQEIKYFQSKFYNNLDKCQNIQIKCLNIFQNTAQRSTSPSNAAYLLHSWHCNLRTVIEKKDKLIRLEPVSLVQKIISILERTELFFFYHLYPIVITTTRIRLYFYTYLKLLLKYWFKEFFYIFQSRYTFFYYCQNVISRSASYFQVQQNKKKNILSS